jgi:hypothetical protein
LQPFSPDFSTRLDIRKTKFKAAIEAPYRWRDWAANPQGVTGDELSAFINNEEAMLLTERHPAPPTLRLFLSPPRFLESEGDGPRSGS